MKAAVGFLAGAVFTYVGVVLVVLMAWEVLGMHDGGGAMTLAFVIAPFFALFGAIAGAILAVRIRRKRPRGRADDGGANSPYLFIACCALAGAIGAHYAVVFGLWIASPLHFDRYWVAWIVSLTPSVASLLGALAGGFIGWRWKRA